MTADPFAEPPTEEPLEEPPMAEPPDEDDGPLEPIEATATVLPFPSVPKDVPVRPQELVVLNRARDLADEVLRIPVPTCHEEYAQLAGVLEMIAAVEHAVHVEMDEPVAAAFALHRMLTSRRGSYLKPLEPAKEHVATIGGQWRIIERRREDEAAREREAIARADRERQVAEATAALEAQGAPAEAVQAAVAEVRAAPVYVTPAAAPVKVAGLAEKEAWSYEIVNRELIPRSYFVLDEKSLQAVVSRQKAACAIPGIRVFATTKVQRTGRR